MAVSFLLENHNLTSILLCSELTSTTVDQQIMFLFMLSNGLFLCFYISATITAGEIYPYTTSPIQQLSKLAVVNRIQSIKRNLKEIFFKLDPESKLECFQLVVPLSHRLFYVRIISCDNPIVLARIKTSKCSLQQFIQISRSRLNRFDDPKVS